MGNLNHNGGAADAPHREGILRSWLVKAALSFGLLLAGSIGWATAASASPSPSAPPPSNSSGASSGGLVGGLVGDQGPVGAAVGSVGAVDPTGTVTRTVETATQQVAGAVDPVVDPVASSVTPVVSGVVTQVAQPVQGAVSTIVAPAVEPVLGAITNGSTRTGDSPQAAGTTSTEPPATSQLAPSDQTATGASSSSSLDRSSDSSPDTLGSTRTPSRSGAESPGATCSTNSFPGAATSAAAPGLDASSTVPTVPEAPTSPSPTSSAVLRPVTGEGDGSSASRWTPGGVACATAPPNCLASEVAGPVPIGRPVGVPRPEPDVAPD